MRGRFSSIENALSIALDHDYSKFYFLHLSYALYNLKYTNSLATQCWRLCFSLNYVSKVIGLYFGLILDDDTLFVQKVLFWYGKKYFMFLYSFSFDRLFCYTGLSDMDVKPDT